jgi:four helix bundle protein
MREFGAGLRQKGYSHDQDGCTIGRMASSAAQTVRNHRDLVVWQRAIDLVECAYDISRRFPADERFGLTSQLRRAAVSVPSNIAEGHGRAHLAEYLHHLSIAKGSLMELETQVVIAGRMAYLTPEMQQRTLNLSGDVGRMLSGLIRALKARRARP